MRAEEAEVMKIFVDENGKWHPLAEEIVTCEECIHAEYCEWRKKDVPNWFCADGERRTDK